MYNPILARSFSKHDQKKIAYWAFVGSLVIALSVCTVFKPHFEPLSTANSQLSTRAGLDLQIVKEANITEPSANSQLSTPAVIDLQILKEANITEPLGDLQLSIPAGPDILIVKEEKSIPEPVETETKAIKPLCSVTEPISDYCEIEGKISIQGNVSTIYIASPYLSISKGNTSWSIKPYARKGMMNVREWQVKLVDENEIIPACTNNHTVPAVLFSIGGYSGNHFHDFSDLLVPLFTTSQKFNGEVHLLATDYKPWWVPKFHTILKKLSRYTVMNIDKENEVHCYKSATVGLKRHKELGIDASKSANGLSMEDFRKFLRNAYTLKRTSITKMRKSNEDRKPRLMIVSRRRSRVFLNEGKIAEMAEHLGFDVVVSEESLSTNSSTFVQIVNSCDVMMGVHGAGLTNMVFLPDKAVIIQIVPWGRIDVFAKLDFGDPSADMNLRYLAYNVRVEETSLLQQYPLDHPVIRDPMSVHRQGWGAIRSAYLDNQNVRLDLRRFRSTLAKALKLLHH